MAGKNKTKKKELSLEQRTKLLLTPCKTRVELHNWIKYHMGMHLPDHTVSRYSDTNPLDVVWLLYDICVNRNNPENIEELLVVAGRGSGKTLGMAIAELLIMLHDRRDVVHVGAILSQAKRCYDYQIKFMLNRQMQEVLNANINGTGAILEKANMEKSIFNLGEDGERTTLEILPCTLKAVNGPHVPLVVIDEIDTVSGEGFKAFKDISGMLDSRGNQKALRVGISTRKTRYGLMNEQIENADAAGRTVKRWTALEFTERCPDSRSGTDPLIAWVNQDDVSVLTEKEFVKKHKVKQAEYFKTELPGSGCRAGRSRRRGGCDRWCSCSDSPER